jgi:hypothetical protein
MHVVRDMGKADDDQLTAIQDGAAHLLDDFEQFMGSHLVEALCLWREAAKRQQERRAADPAVKPLRAIQAG